MNKYIDTDTDTLCVAFDYGLLKPAALIVQTCTPAVHLMTFGLKQHVRLKQGLKL